MQLPDSRRADIMNRTVNLKSVSPKAAQIIEKQVMTLLAEIEAEKNSIGSSKVAELMNEMDKPQVDTLLTSLESISREAVNKVRPKIFLFEDILLMPQRSRVMLLNDISADILTMALRGAPVEIREFGPLLDQPAPAPHDRIGPADRHCRHQSARNRNCPARRRPGSDPAGELRSDPAEGNGRRSNGSGLSHASVDKPAGGPPCR